MADAAALRRSKRDALPSLPVGYTEWQDKGSPQLFERWEIGHFSLVGENGDYSENKSQLKHLYLPSFEDGLELDLDSGHDTAIRKDRRHGTPSRLDNILLWISKNREKVEKQRDTQRLDADFVCRRGTLERILCSPYEVCGDWLLGATKIGGTIYVCHYETERERQRTVNMSELQERTRFWGRKFEQYMVTDQPGVPPKTDAILNEHEGYYTVLRGRLETHSLLFVAEVDAEDPGVKERTPTSTDHYVELKTSKLCLTEKQRRNVCRFKTMQWWAQCFPVGIPRLICGFRDDNGLVRSMADFRVSDLPRFGKGYWSEAVCLNFCNVFLSHVKEIVVGDDPNIVYLFRLIPREEIRCTLLEDPGEYRILPDWYLEYLNPVAGRR